MAQPTSTLRDLILVQSIYELGESSYDKVSQIVSAHPLLANIDTNLKLDSAALCDARYEELLQEYNISRDSNVRKVKKNGPEPWIQNLAQMLFKKFTEQLMGEMSQDEEEFKQEYARLQQLQQK